MEFNSWVFNLISHNLKCWKSNHTRKVQRKCLNTKILLYISSYFTHFSWMGNSYLPCHVNKESQSLCVKILRLPVLINLYSVFGGAEVKYKQTRWNLIYSKLTHIKLPPGQHAEWLLGLTTQRSAGQLAAYQCYQSAACCFLYQNEIDCKVCCVDCQSLRNVWLSCEEFTLFMDDAFAGAWTSSRYIS